MTLPHRLHTAEPEVFFVCVADSFLETHLGVIHPSGRGTSVTCHTPTHMFPVSLYADEKSERDQVTSLLNAPFFSSAVSTTN